MNDPLPGPVARWLEVVGQSALDLETAVIEGRARFRRDGKGLWLPIEAVMWHELGRNHVADLRFGFGPITIVRGLDGYVDGTGFSRISHMLDMGREIDQSASLFMWSEAILFPGSWYGRDDIEWTATDDLNAEVALPLGPEQIVVHVEFDAPTAMPARFSADRYKGVGTGPVEWIVEYADWKPTRDGVMLPGLATVTWSDEPGPWFRMWIERANPGADVSGALARGREVLAAAAADPTRRPR